MYVTGLLTNRIRKSLWGQPADTIKHEKEQMSRTVQEMFEEADMWLVSD
ncbi:DinI family protein [Citrobacter sp. wls828]|nr:DinI-like family protein [Citrobacter youngae]MBJ9110791.1 DinI-like family protein [Citrobacter sp. FDAARGOS_156]TKU05714.1 DinI family protein [Citrobacter sp. wls828]MBJ9601919.1 DinI-like family protein [Citrobacter sp. FDAARGOS_156]HEF0085336.1 DinI-like family protein [Citrobacter youngae]